MHTVSATVVSVWYLLELTDIERVLGTYSLEEIMELNERTEEEVLYFLVSVKYLTLPDPLPTDVEQ